MGMTCLQTDLVIAKTFVDKFEALSYGKDEGEKMKILENLTVSHEDLNLMRLELQKTYMLFGNMEFEKYFEYYPYVFKPVGGGSYGLRVENLKDEKGGVDLANFFVGMFIPNFYDSNILSGLGFDEKYAYRTTGPWAHCSWAFYATQATHIPGDNSMRIIENREIANSGGRDEDVLRKSL